MKTLFKTVIDGFRSLFGKNIQKSVIKIRVTETDPAIFSMCCWAFSDALRMPGSSGDQLPFVTIKSFEYTRAAFDDGSVTYKVTADLCTLSTASIYHIDAMFKIIREKNKVMWVTESGWDIISMSFDIFLPEILDHRVEFVSGLTDESDPVIARYVRHFQHFLICASRG